ncbi:MAG: thiamine pyrophosphate-dependent enzyme [Acidobacteriota bacterium]
MKEGYEVIYKKPKTLTDNRMHYCPGCIHGIVHKIFMELIEEMDLQERTVGVCPVGCSVFAYDYMNVDMQEAAHGRAGAVATAVKRMLPDRIVFSYQGDGDLAAIGTAETIHACNRGENFLFIFINNGIYGMTGGQMAPTTLNLQKTTTSPYGRETKDSGAAIKMTEIVKDLEGVAYAARVSCNTPANVRKTKRILKRALEIQEQDLGTQFVEVVSNCPSGWRCTPVESMEWIKDKSIPYYPLGVFKEPGK